MAINSRSIAVNSRLIAVNNRLIAVNSRLIAVNNRFMTVNIRLMAVNIRSMTVNTRLMTVSSRSMAVNIRFIPVSSRSMAVNNRSMAVNSRFMASNKNLVFQHILHSRFKTKLISESVASFSTCPSIKPFRSFLFQLKLNFKYIFALLKYIDKKLFMIDKNDLKFGLFTDKKLIGKRLKMSLSNDRTYELWHDFMPRRNEITNKKNSDLICMQVYDPTLDFNDFSPETEFEKWAAIEVSDFDAVPEGMETYTIKAGLFVLFTFKGTQLEFSDLYRYIITKWLPTTEFKLDQREHFQILGEKYKNNDPNSEEKVFIPLWVHGDTTLDDLLGMCFNKKTMDNLILTANLYHL